MGDVLPFGQMSFWGATVITNLLSPFPCLIEWVCGGHYVYNPTLKRFFLFHFQFPFFFCGFIILHLFYLHFHSSNNPLRLNTNNKIPFFPFIFLKDLIGFLLILCLYLLQTHFGISSFSHPDNALEVCGLLTPLHIVPEWYFLCQYAMLKAVPNKNAGFIILLTSIFTFFLFGEIRNLTTFTRLMRRNKSWKTSPNCSKEINLGIERDVVSCLYEIASNKIWKLLNFIKTYDNSRHRFPDSLSWTWEVLKVLYFIVGKTRTLSKPSHYWLTPVPYQSHLLERGPWP